MTQISTVSSADTLVVLEAFLMVLRPFGDFHRTFQALSGNILATMRGWGIVSVGLDDVQK